MYTLGAGSKKKLDGVHPKLRSVIETAITHSPIDFTVTDGVRTLEQQKKLYEQGRSTAGKIVTNADGVMKKSNHQVKADGYGYAVDLYPYVDGKLQVHHADTVRWLTEIAGHIKGVASSMGVTIEWGGDWASLKDYPHVELKA
jgi:peptidoglycan L-alanyl-D-glutamate endopeptidase CwlK